MSDHIASAYVLNRSVVYHTHTHTHVSVSFSSFFHNNSCFCIYTCLTVLSGTQFFTLKDPTSVVFDFLVRTTEVASIPCCDEQFQACPLMGVRGTYPEEGLLSVFYFTQNCQMAPEISLMVNPPTYGARGLLSPHLFSNTCCYLAFQLLPG